MGKAYTGVSSKFVTMIKAIYSHVSSCVKLSNNSNISDFFNLAIGLKQVEPLSPLMFILFVNDIKKQLGF